MVGRPRKITDKTNQVFDKLTVIKLDVSREGGRVPYWICKCTCGNEVSVRTDRLGTDKFDCGCVQKAILSARNSVQNRTHGLSKTRLFKIWTNMNFRCQSPKSPNYMSYGGRGIKVCPEWSESVDSFIEWANNNGYESNLTIERIDVNKDYEPSNCKWITQKEQGYNKRNTLHVEINGITKTLPEWSEETGINKNTLSKRYYQLGWRGEKLISPVR
jgi:hypothetical protein